MVHNQPRYNTMNTRRRPPSLRTWVLRGALLLAVLIGVVLGCIYLLRVPLAELWLTSALREQGFREARLEVQSFGPDVYAFQNVSLGLRGGGATRVVVRGTLGDLLKGRLEAMEVDGLYLPLSIGDGHLSYPGLPALPLPFAPDTPEQNAETQDTEQATETKASSNLPAIPVPRQISVRNATLVLTETDPAADAEQPPPRVFALSINADLTEQAGNPGRADGTAQIALAPARSEDGTQTDPAWLSLDWLGDLDPLGLASAALPLPPDLLRGTLSTHANMVAETLPGYRHLGPVTLTGALAANFSDTGVVVSGPMPLVLQTAAITAHIPENLRALLDDALNLSISGTDPATGPRLAFGKGHADADLAINLDAGETQVALAVRGDIAAQSGENAADSPADIRMQTVTFSARNLSLPTGRLDATFAIADLQGTLGAAQGTFTLDGAVTDLSTPALTAPSMTFRAGGTLQPMTDRVSLILSEFLIEAPEAQSPLDILRITKPIVLKLAPSDTATQTIRLSPESEDRFLLTTDIALDPDPLGALIKGSDGWAFFGADASAIRLQTLVQTGAQLPPRINATFSGLRLATPYAALVGGSGDMELTLEEALSGRMSAQGVLEQVIGEDGFHRARNITASATYDANGNTAFDGALDVGDFAKVVRFSGSAAPGFANGEVTFDASSLPFSKGGLQPGQLHEVLAGMTFTKGVVRAEGTVPWGETSKKPTIDVRIEDADFTYGPVTLYTTNAAVALTGLTPLASPPSQPAAAAVIDFGIPATLAELSYHFDGAGALLLEKANMTFADGNIATEQARIPLDGSNGSLLLGVSEISVGALAEQAGLAGLSGDGRLSGALPLRLEGGELFVDNARLSASGPGVLRYAPGTGSGLTGTGQAGVEVLLQTLSDFRYKSLDITLNGPLAGEMDIGFAIKGANPAYQNGKAVEFNLTVQGELGEIISQSVRGYTLPDRIRERIEKVYGATGG